MGSPAGLNPGLPRWEGYLFAADTSGGSVWAGSKRVEIDKFGANCYSGDAQSKKNEVPLSLVLTNVAGFQVVK